MSGLEIQKINPTTTPNKSSDSNGLSQNGVEVSFKYDKVELTSQDKRKIIAMLKLTQPKVQWDELSEAEQQHIIAQYKDGTLQKQCEAFQDKLDAFKKSIKNMSTEEASQFIVETILRREVDNYDSLSNGEKRQLRREKALAFLEKHKVNTKNIGERRKAFAEEKLTFDAIIFAFQSGKIPENLEELDKFLTDPDNIVDMQYDWAKYNIEKDPKILKSLKPKDQKQVNALNRGELRKELQALAEEAGTSLKELLEKGEYDSFVFEHLSKKAQTGKLNSYEQSELNSLKKLHSTFNGDLSGVKTTNANDDVDEDFLFNVFNEDEDVNFDTPSPEQFARIKECIATNLKDCETPEEQEAFIKNLLASGSSGHNALYQTILAELESENVIDSNTLIAANKASGLSEHQVVACSVHGSLEHQTHTAELVAACCTGENPTMTQTQAEGYTTNVIPQYQVEAQAPATKTMTDTGLVDNVLGETYDKLDQTAAKEAYEYAMNSESISTERKALIARDAIDGANNADMKNYFKGIADNLGVDYTSVPPKSERNTTSETTNQSSEEKIDGTNFTAKEISQLLGQSSQPENFWLTALNGAKETLEIILGNTPENKVETQKFDSINSAIKELKAGGKLTDVFKNSTLDVKKNLVSLICSYGKIAISTLINTFGGDTIYAMAKNQNQKDLIKKEIERIALSDATQRVALEEIEKLESKNGISAKA